MRYEATFYTNGNLNYRQPLELHQIDTVIELWEAGQIEISTLLTIKDLKLNRVLVEGYKNEITYDCRDEPDPVPGIETLTAVLSPQEVLAP